MMVESNPFTVEAQVIHAIVSLPKEERYAKSIQDEIDVTYSHLFDIVSKYEELGFITRQKIGQKKVIQPSEEAVPVFNAISRAFEVHENLVEKMGEVPDTEVEEVSVEADVSTRVLREDEEVHIDEVVDGDVEFDVLTCKSCPEKVEQVKYAKLHSMRGEDHEIWVPRSEG